MPKLRTSLLRRWGLVLSVVLGAPSLGWAAPCAQDLPPRFEDFPAEPAGTATRPALKLSNAFAREYRTSLREGLAHWPVDFAGHYVMVTHGCGTTCMTGGWVDAISGEATPLPVILDSFGPFEIDDPLLFRLDSRLLVTLGSAAGDETRPQASYYEWTGAELRPVCTRILTADEARSLGRAVPEKF